MTENLNDLDDGGVELISAEKRKGLPTSSFALPEQKKYPIDTAARTRNAAARLEQAKAAGKIGGGDYTKAKKRIAAAAKKFGIDSKFNGDLTPSDVHVPGTVAPQPRKRGLKMVFDHPTHGRVEVSHQLVAGGDQVCFSRFASCELEASAAGGEANAPVWIQVAKVGHYVKNGRHFDLTPETFDQIVRNFNATENRRVRVDYEHESTEGMPPPGGWPAKGWSTQLDNRGQGGLWALTEFLEPLKSQIRAKQYKFVSPAIWFNAKDRNTGAPIGAWLDSIAATNDPFLDGMQPLAASAKRGLAMTPPHEAMPRIKAALGLHPLESLARCSEVLGSLRTACMTAADAGKTIADPHEGIDLRGYMSALSEIAPGHTYTEDLLDAMQEMIDAAIAQHNLERHDSEGSDADIDDDANMAASTPETITMTTNANAQQPTTAPAAPAAATPPATDTTPAAAPANTEALEARFALRMSELEAKNKTLETQLVEMTTKQRAAGEESQVDALILSGKLAPASRKMALAYLRADKTAFEAEYPPVSIPAGQGYLLANLSGVGAANARQTDPALDARVAKFTAKGEDVTTATKHAHEEIAAENAPPNRDELVAKYMAKETANGASHNDALARACMKADEKVRAHFEKLRNGRNALGL
jgi:hypothetical protein